MGRKRDVFFEMGFGKMNGSFIFGGRVLEKQTDGVMTRSEKAEILKNYLSQEPENYRDTFKTDMYLFFNEDFTKDNPLLTFLDSFENKNEIENWVDVVASQIVLKFDEEFEEVGDFIGEFIKLNKV